MPDKKPWKTVTVGEKYGRWLIVRPVERKRYYECLCDCGKTKEVRDDSILCGQSLSCGCLCAEKASVSATERFTTHGLSGSKVWSAYKDMRGRCNNPKYLNYKNYGRWGLDFVNVGRARTVFLISYKIWDCRMMTTLLREFRYKGITSREIANGRPACLCKGLTKD